MSYARSAIFLIAMVLAPMASAYENEFDKLARAVVESLVQADVELASVEASTLVNRYPDSALGQWMFAEIQAINGYSPSSIANAEQMSKPLLDILLEARSRLHARAPTEEQLPANILQTNANTRHVVLVDLSASQLWLFDTSSDSPTLVRTHYIASGAGGFGKFEEGDLKTPLGLYRIRGRRSDASLPDLYGTGALILNYPNAFDIQRGRRGSGIWLHGVPKAEWNRAPLSSEGCVTMANSLFSELAETVDLATTDVILESQVKWLSPADINTDRQEFLGLFKRFQNAWQYQTYSELQNLYSEDLQPYAGMAIDGPLNRVSNTRADDATAASLDATLLQNLDGVLPESINLLRHRSLNSDKSFRSVTVMTFEIGPARRQVALYWAKDDSGYWRIVHQIIPPSSV